MLYAVLGSPSPTSAQDVRASYGEAAGSTTPAELSASYPSPDGGPDLVALYDAAGTATVLMGPTGPLPGTGRLLDGLRRVGDHGVDPTRYLLDALDEAWAASVSGGLRERGRQRLDFLLVRGLALMAHDLDVPPERLRPETFLQALRTAAAGEGAAADMLRSWLPPFAEYGHLVRAYKRYRRLALEEADKGLALPLRSLPRPGQTSALVSHLRRRLALEGYDAPPREGADPRTYGGPLREAVGHYQYAHGLKATGTIDKATARLLNVPLIQRARQLALAMARWRASPSRRFQTFLRVNIPQFAAQLYEGRRLVAQHRVVVGRAGRTTDPRTGERGYFNRSPELQSEIDRVVFNPVWRIPKRIKESEIDPKLEEDPSYADRQGILVRGSLASESAVQLPGPHNPLGRVKFLFDNPYGVYLHDTPLRGLFRRKKRAFSHGCIRLENPMGLARYLLSRERHPAATRIDGLLRGWHETELTLSQPLPIIIEYNTVSMDGEGRVAFLDDIYGQDDAMFERLPLESELRK